MTDNFFEKFRRFFPLDKEKRDEYISYYHRIEVPARTILLREGEVSRKAYLIEPSHPTALGTAPDHSLFRRAVKRVTA